MGGPNPDVDQGKGHSLGFGRQPVPEKLGEQRVHDGVEALFGEPIPVALGFPHVDVAETALWSLGGDVADQTLRRLVPRPCLIRA